MIQATAMGAFVNEEAMYFFAYRDGAGDLLDGRNTYRLRFAAGQLPPLNEPGFWSLTMYNDVVTPGAEPHRPLHPPAGHARAHAGARTGVLILHLAAAKPADAPEGNWLPAPEGPFNVALRTYLPRAEIVAGAWFPSAIARMGE